VGARARDRSASWPGHTAWVTRAGAPPRRRGAEGRSAPGRVGPPLGRAAPLGPAEMRSPWTGRRSRRVGRSPRSTRRR
jgi:hypothetical protein